MGEAEKSFRFLTDAEFLALNGDARTTYLLRASEELEARRRRLIEQTQKHINIQHTDRGDPRASE